MLHLEHTALASFDPQQRCKRTSPDGVTAPRRHRGYECLQAPYFAGAQLAHFAEQNVVQTIFGPPGLLGPKKRAGRGQQSLPPLEAVHGPSMGHLASSRDAPPRTRGVHVPDLAFSPCHQGCCCMVPWRRVQRGLGLEIWVVKSGFAQNVRLKRSKYALSKDRRGGS